MGDPQPPRPGAPRHLGPVSARRLMARLREVMAGSGAALERLGKVVTVVAAETGADVCSCYVLRAGEVLELFATVGLDPGAVRRTRLRMDEGMVGAVAQRAQPVVVRVARDHPAFSYRPETKEDPDQSFCGVPILRGGRVRGVLVLQSASRRDWAEDDVELLETVAMVAAELIGSGELVPAAEFPQPEASTLMPARLDGFGIIPGVAFGRAVLHRPRPPVRHVIADNPAEELKRFHNALATLRDGIDRLASAARADGHGDTGDILDAYAMFAEDRGWLHRIRVGILQGLTAEAAVAQAQNVSRARIGRVWDPLLRERLSDLEDLTDRLLGHLAGRAPDDASATLPEDVVLIARSLGPAQLLAYDPRRLRGLVLEEGSAASHVAVVARALDIPVVGACAGALERIEPLDPVVVDGAAGSVWVRPNEDLVANVAAAAERRQAWRLRHRALVDLPAVTRDGVAVALHLNAGLPGDLEALADTGAEGIGLYRTEIPFLVGLAAPAPEAQIALYREILAAAGGRPVTFRTFDIGGDKQVPGLPTDPHGSPLGWRALRIGLDRPAILRTQLRALIAAAEGRPLRVMFPLVSEVAELDAARRILALEMARAARPPARLETGVMLEVPALLWQLDLLLARVDFVALGSNDLMQYLFAADRADPALNRRYDTLSPAMLRLIRQLAEATRAAGRPLSVCGEMAGRPLDAMALVALGVPTLSVAPRDVGAIKAMVRSLDAQALARFLHRQLDRPNHSLREPLRQWAVDHRVTLEGPAAMEGVATGG